MTATTVTPDPACPKDTGTHGTVGAYQWGCRCPQARKAANRYWKHHRAGILTSPFVPVLGTSRRLQALAAIAWGIDELAVHADVNRARLALWRAGNIRPSGGDGTRASVRRETHERIVRLYDELSMTPGPAKRARLHAVRVGWAPPLAWDDADIDDPTAVPDLGAEIARPGGGKMDLGEVARQHAAGRSIAELSRATGVSETWIVTQLRGAGHTIHELLPSELRTTSYYRRVA